MGLSLKFFLTLLVKLRAFCTLPLGSRAHLTAVGGAEEDFPPEEEDLSVTMLLSSLAGTACPTEAHCSFS